MKTIRIKIHEKKDYDLAISLIKTKQRFKNLLLILINSTSSKNNVNYYLQDFKVIRTLLNGSTTNKEYQKVEEVETYFKDRNLYHLIEQIKSFDYIRDKILVDIVKELKVDRSLAFDGFKQGRTNYPTFKAKKLHKMYHGSIDFNSNIVRYDTKNNLLKFNFFSKKSNAKKMEITHYVNLSYKNNIEVKSCRYSWHHTDLYLEILYIDKNDITLSTNHNGEQKYASIDPGLNNVVTLFMQDVRPYLFKCRMLKSINREMHQLIPKLDKENKSYVKNYLYTKRKRIILQEFNYISNFIVKKLIENNITTLIYGHNKDQKKELNLGRNNNKKFYGIPHFTLLNMLKWKCEEKGIRLIEQEESYTSKCSCLSDEVWKYKYSKNGKQNTKKFNGIRGITRKGIKHTALFKDTLLNKTFHSDINGAVNILQKYLKRHIDIKMYQLTQPILID